ncbi:radical SAM protein [Sporanaerobium hydrogeniformans]|uniref:Radical SAM protein n=1 Tax=Sporanaerobium hydrogeniformans TaxID=3072179 RepID=A0AC61DEX1_9FIRM|nr:radical SAM protein [Sporanaerobium hydrogeniformans]PHV71348.1 radical SAM protein [Sporanaerobium hydrogeniformans]
MKAIRIDGQTPGGKRTNLAQALPLDTPYIVQVFPVYACNFSCEYCIHSVPLNERSYIADKKMLELGVYKKCIDDLTRFPQPIKMLRFAGTGEPLLHPNITEMVAYAKEKGVAKSIDIVTNGALLTKKLADKLISAGLSKLRISIQGVTEKQYKNITQREVNLEELVQNISYFYKNRKETQVYIKIIDCAIEKNEETLFFDMFGDICDTIAIEHLLPAVPQIDYKSKFNVTTHAVTQNGNKLLETQVCPQPFYMMQINPEGNIVPCCAMETTTILGNCTEVSLYDIWNGKEFNSFRLKQLSNQKNEYPICRTCSQYRYMMSEEDLLDKEVKRLIDFYL